MSEKLSRQVKLADNFVHLCLYFQISVKELGTKNSSYVKRGYILISIRS